MVVNIERSIIKKYRKEIWSNFVKAVKKYEMICEGDKICVCVSGGKDSILLAKCLQEIQRHGEISFELKFMLADPGYDISTLAVVEQNAEVMRIPLERFQTHIFDIVKQVDGDPCYLCARMRRGHLYSGAKDLGCNKIALGHHQDDVIETIMLNLFYGAETKTMMPKLRSRNFEGMELIRPLYHVKEESIIAWRNYNNLKFINCACPLNDACEIDGVDESLEFAKKVLNSHILGTRPILQTGKRKEIKNLLKILNTINPEIKQNIFNGLENINLDAVVGYRSGGERKSFLDNYQE
ncbi:MAG: tRNA 2-thiocytidine biosynthesis protein TtcA [Defluviitaleaceae bacterium]|nr:tRNA 2-thiocytidine biosynthesis protein TtcA [Defluviitaleaceae bacterium]